MKKFVMIMASALLVLGMNAQTAKPKPAKDTTKHATATKSGTKSGSKSTHKGGSKKPASSTATPKN